MAQAYTPGLKVIRRHWHSCRRLLPVTGEVVVAAGDRVEAEEVVARTSLPGDVSPVNLANALSISPAEVPDTLLHQVGDEIAAGAPLARNAGLFGWFPKEYSAPVAGTIEAVSPVTGQVILRGLPHAVEVKAFLQGRVTEVIPGRGVVIEAAVTLVQGIFGVGGETYGVLRMAGTAPDTVLTADLIKPDMRGAIIVGGARVTAEALTAARAHGVAAIVAGGIDDHDLRDFLGFDLGVAVTGSEALGLTVIVTEGFGNTPMAERTHRLLAARAGSAAAVNGATQIRAGVIRPEIVIPWPDDHASETQAPIAEAGHLAIGRQVRMIRDPYFGMLGIIVELPAEAQILGSESRARVVVVELAAGERITVPRANVELIESDSDMP